MVWRNTLGQFGANLAADQNGASLGNADGVVDAYDYNYWSYYFGETTDGHWCRGFARGQRSGAIGVGLYTSFSCANKCSSELDSVKKLERAWTVGPRAASAPAIELSWLLIAVAGMSCSERADGYGGWAYNYVCDANWGRQLSE